MVSATVHYLRIYGISLGSVVSFYYHLLGLGLLPWNQFRSIFLAEQGMQTKIESVSVDTVLVMPDKVSIQAGPDEISFADQIAHIHFSDLSTPNDLAGSQSDILECGPWTDNDHDDDY